MARHSTSARGLVPCHTFNVFNPLKALSALVNAAFGKKLRNLQVSTLQAIVLENVLDGVTLSFEDLRQHLNLEEAILKPWMNLLSCVKCKVIAKTPACRKITTTDAFAANAKFLSNVRKICVPIAA